MWNPHFEGADLESQQNYDFQDRRSWLYANVYLKQHQGKELIFFRNDIAGNLRRQDERVVNIEYPDSRLSRVVQLEAIGAGGRWIIWHWYEVGGTITVSDRKAKYYKLSMSFPAARRLG